MLSCLLSADRVRNVRAAGAMGDVCRVFYGGFWLGEVELFASVLCFLSGMRALIYADLL